MVLSSVLGLPITVGIVAAPLNFTRRERFNNELTLDLLVRSFDIVFVPFRRVKRQLELETMRLR